MGSTLTHAFSDSVKAPDLKKITPKPEVQKPASMPDEVDLKRKAAQAAAKKPSTGRDSTILTDYEQLG
jgi:hypothetical protein